MLHSQIKPLLIFSFILACIHVAEALKGDRVLKANSDSLLTYMRFGFLKGGTIEKELSLIGIPDQNTLAYLLVCDSEAKEDIVEASKESNICEGVHSSYLIAGCAVKHVVFNDVKGNTKVLPFKDPKFIEELITLDDMYTTKRSQGTSVQDISNGDFYDNLLLADNSFENNKLLNEKESEKNVQTSEEDSRHLKQNDPDQTLIQAVLTSWLKYEDIKKLPSVTKSNTSGKFDNNGSADPIDLSKLLDNKISYMIQKEGTYFFLMMSCVNKVRAEVDFTLLNPNGEHLPTGELENKEIYYIMIIIWGVLFSFWIGTWLLNLCQKHKTYALHYFFLLAGLFSFTFSIVEEKYWKTFSKTGYSPIGIRVASTFVSGIAFSLFLTLFLLIGKGYTYINLKLSPKDKRDICLYVTILIILIWMDEFFGTNVILNLCIVCLYIASFVTVFRDFRKSLSKITYVLESIQLPQPRSATIQSENEVRVGAREEIEIEGARGTNRNQQEINVQLNRNAQQNSNNNSRRNRMQEGNVPDSERDVKVLRKKLGIVKLIRLFVLMHIILLSASYIVAVAFFLYKPYVINLWCQILLAFMYFQFTWFFNYKYKHAFAYSNNMGNIEDNSELQGRSTRNPGNSGQTVNLKDLYKIVGEFVVVEDGLGDNLRLASKIEKPVSLPRSATTEEQLIDNNKNEFTKRKQKKNNQNITSAKYILHESEKELEASKPQEIQVNKEISIRKDNQKNKKEIIHKELIKPESISLHFEDEVIDLEEAEEIFEIGEKKNNVSNSKIFEKRYPKPRFAKPIDFRKNMNDSFHNEMK